MLLSTAALRLISRVTQSTTRLKPRCVPQLSYTRQIHHVQPTYLISHHLFDRYYTTDKCSHDSDAHMKDLPPKSSEMPIETEADMARYRSYYLTCHFCGEDYEPNEPRAHFKSCIKDAEKVLKCMEIMFERAEEIEKNTIESMRSIIAWKIECKHALEGQKKQIAVLEVWKSEY